MASLRGARFALAPRCSLSISSPANPLHASLRPQLRHNAPFLAQGKCGARNLSFEAVANGSVQLAYDFLVAVESHCNVTNPWIASIMGLAVVTSTARLPLQLYAQHIAVRQAAVNHIVVVWRHLLAFRPAPQANKLARERRRILREWGAQDWKTFTPALGLPIWIICSQAVKQLCENSYRNRGPAISAVEGAVSEGAASVSDQTTALSTTSDGISTGAQSAAAGLDLGVYDGAGQLLFDLGAPDPYFIGPMALGVTMFYNFYPRDSDMRRMVIDIYGTPLNHLPFRTRLGVRCTRIALTGSVVVPFIIMHLPSGLLLYWISSMWCKHVIHGLHRLTGEPDQKERLRAVTVKPAIREDWVLRRSN